MTCFGNPKFPIAWACSYHRCIRISECASLKVKNTEIMTKSGAEITNKED